MEDGKKLPGVNIFVNGTLIFENFTTFKFSKSLSKLRISESMKRVNIHTVIILSNSYFLNSRHDSPDFIFSVR